MKKDDGRNPLSQSFDKAATGKSPFNRRRMTQGKDGSHAAPSAPVMKFAKTYSGTPKS